MEATENGNGDKLKKWAITETKTLVSVFLAGSGIILWGYNLFYNPIRDVQADIELIQKDIATIQNNHEAHMQTALEEIKNLHAKDVELQEQEQETEKQMVRILTILERK